MMSVFLVAVLVAQFRTCAYRPGVYWLAVAHFALGPDAVWSFWIAYILTRPLGASVGDYLVRGHAPG